MELACAEGLNGKNWKATDGIFKISAKIEIAESKDLNLQNNTCEAELQIPNGKAVPVQIARVLN
jgi:beta-glucosidase